MLCSSAKFLLISIMIGIAIAKEANPSGKRGFSTCSISKFGNSFWRIMLTKSTAPAVCYTYSPGSKAYSTWDEAAKEHGSKLAAVTAENKACLQKMLDQLAEKTEQKMSGRRRRQSSGGGSVAGLSVKRFEKESWGEAHPALLQASLDTCTRQMNTYPYQKFRLYDGAKSRNPHLFF